MLHGSQDTVVLSPKGGSTVFLVSCLYEALVLTKIATNSTLDMASSFSSHAGKFYKLHMASLAQYLQV